MAAFTDFGAVVVTGPRGPGLLIGDGAPTDNVGQIGDSYLALNGDAYVKSEAGWDPAGVFAPALVDGWTKVQADARFPMLANMSLFFRSLQNDADAPELLTSLGFSSFAAGLRATANGAAFLTAIGALSQAQVDARADARISTFVGSTPAALDTLMELAAALGNDPNFATTVTNALAGKQPLDADLTAIAALTTTSFGRGLLTRADDAAVRAYIGQTNTVTIVSSTGAPSPAIAAADIGQKRYVFTGSGDITVPLPPLAGVTEGAPLALQNDKSAGLVTIDADGSEIVDGGSIAILAPGQQATLIRIGSAWVFTQRPAMRLRALETKPAGTDAGSATGGANATRTVALAGDNTIAGASLASAQFTLPAGRYSARGFGVANKVSGHKAFLYNVTDAAVVATGESAFTDSTSTVNTVSRFDEVFSITASKVFELRHYTQSGRAGDGLGKATGSLTEVYAGVTFDKIG